MKSRYIQYMLLLEDPLTNLNASSCSAGTEAGPPIAQCCSCVAAFPYILHITPFCTGTCVRPSGPRLTHSRSDVGRVE